MQVRLCPLLKRHRLSLITGTQRSERNNVRILPTAASSTKHIRKSTSEKSCIPIITSVSKLPSIAKLPSVTGTRRSISEAERDPVYILSATKTLLLLGAQRNQNTLSRDHIPITSSRLISISKSERNPIHILPATKMLLPLGA